MKLVREYDDANEAEIISVSLRERGVMTTVTSADSQRLGRFKSGSLKMGLWVMFEEQLNDAVQLLKNPEHEPEHCIPLDQMHRIETEAKVRHEKSFSKIFEKSFTYIFASGLLVLIVYVIIGIISEA